MLKRVLIDEALEVLFQRARDFRRSPRARAVISARLLGGPLGGDLLRMAPKFAHHRGQLPVLLGTPAAYAGAMGERVTGERAQQVLDLLQGHNLQNIGPSMKRRRGSSSVMASAPGR